MYISLELCLIDAYKGLRPAVFSKEIGRDDIHARISALGRKYRRDQKFERVRVIQSTVRIRVFFF